MRHLSRSGVASLLLYAFLPWILVYIFQFAFIGEPDWRESIHLIGPLWVFLAPFVTLVTVGLFIDEAVENQQKGTHGQRTSTRP